MFENEKAMFIFINVGSLLKLIIPQIIMVCDEVFSRIKLLKLYES